MDSKKRLNHKNKYSLLGSLLVLLIILTGITFVIYIRQRIVFEGTNQTSLEDREYRYHYAMIVGEHNDFWSNAYSGALDEAISNDAYVELFGNKLSNAYDKKQLMKMAIEAGVDGVIIEPDDQEGLDELIALALEANIPVVTLLEDLPYSDRISYVGVSYYNLGLQYADQIVKAMNSKNRTANNGFDTTTFDYWNVMVLMDQNVNDSARNIVYGAINESLNTRQDIRGNVSVSARVIENNNAFEAEEAIRNIFVFEEKLPDIIVCLDESSGACVYQALVDYNQVGDIELISYYTSDAILSGIDKSIIFSTIGVDAYSMGKNSVEALNEYIETGFASSYYVVDTYVINSENIEEFMGGESNE